MGHQPEQTETKRGLLAELRRRHVVRAAIVYAVAVWALAQGISQLSPAFGLAPRVTLWFVIACVIGFPFWIAFAWFFKFTTSGIARESEVEKDATAIRRGGRHLDYWIIGILAIAVVLLLTNQLVLQRGKTLREFTVTPAAPVATKIPAKSIAVLPFENLSNDKNNAYFVAGMQDLILTKLADIGGLKVIARTSTEQYKSHPTNLKTIGQQLGVATVLEGSVQKQGDEVLINVQLIDTQTDAHVWAQAYTRKLDNIFGVEGEVAGKIAAALKAKLSPAEAARVASIPTTNPKATNLFLRADYQFTRSLAQLDPVTMRASLPLYRQAVAAEPRFALAWARLSHAESLIAFTGGGGASVPQLKADARADAARAHALAPDAAATQIALGYVAYYGRLDYPAALKAFRAVLAVRPNSTDAIAAVGYILRRQGHTAAAIAQFKRALALDPRNAYLTYVLGRTYVWARRYAEALAPLQRARALDPGNGSYGYEYALAVTFGSGDLKRAWTAAEGNAPLFQFAQVNILILQRRYAAAIAFVKGVPDTPDNFGVNSFWTVPKALKLADLYRLAGDTPHARPLYEKARRQLHAQLKAQAGNAVTVALAWSHLADAELGVGRRKAAFAAASKSLKLADQLKLFLFRLQVQNAVADFYAQAGRADLAVPLLAKLLAAPNSGEIIAPVLLRLNPRFDPIRHDPRFQALLKQYPAPAASTAAH